MPSFDVPAIDPIFSLECLKLNEMKNLFKVIFEQLTRLDSKIENIPDLGQINADITFLKKDQKEQWDFIMKKFKEVKSDQEGFEENVMKKIKDLDLRLSKADSI